MADLLTVTDPTDPRLHDYVGLTDVGLRRRREPEEGIFIAEGEKVIRRAVETGYPVRSMLMSQRWLAGLGDVLDRVEAPVYVGEESLLLAVTGYRVHRGALASLARKPLPSAERAVAGARRVVVLEDVNDPTNVGVVFRGAAALGMDAVLLSPECADPLYRRSVRVSMGAVFAIPYARLVPWPRALRGLSTAGYRLLALTPDPDATPLPELGSEHVDRCALLLGAEGPGLSRRALAAADLRVRIPMAHGVDSLNVGAAAAVAFYALTYSAASPGAPPVAPR